MKDVIIMFRDSYAIEFPNENNNDILIKKIIEEKHLKIKKFYVDIKQAEYRLKNDYIKKLEEKEKLEKELEKQGKEWVKPGNQSQVTLARAMLGNRKRIKQLDRELKELYDFLLEVTEKSAKRDEQYFIERAREYEEPIEEVNSNKKYKNKVTVESENAKINLNGNKYEMSLDLDNITDKEKESFIKLSKETCERIEKVKDVRDDVVVRALLEDEKLLNNYLDLCELYNGDKEVQAKLKAFKLEKGFPKIEYNLKDKNLSEDDKVKMYAQAKKTQEVFESTGAKNVKINIKSKEKESLEQRLQEETSNSKKVVEHFDVDEQKAAEKAKNNEKDKTKEQTK